MLIGKILSLVKLLNYLALSLSGKIGRIIYPYYEKYIDDEGELCKWVSNAADCEKTSQSSQAHFHQ
jgi:hypothetical protein